MHINGVGNGTRICTDSLAGLLKLINTVHAQKLNFNFMQHQIEKEQKVIGHHT